MLGSYFLREYIFPVTPEKRFRLCLNEDEIFELPEYSKKIFKRNVVDRYIDRPKTKNSGGQFAVLDTLCFAKFSRYYYLPSNPKYKEVITNQKNLTMNQCQVRLT